MNFYHGVVNKTNITFSDDKLGLLNKGLKYNLSKKKKNGKNGSATWRWKQ